MSVGAGCEGRSADLFPALKPFTLSSDSAPAYPAPRAAGRPAAGPTAWTPSAAAQGRLAPSPANHGGKGAQPAISRPAAPKVHQVTNAWWSGGRPAPDPLQSTTLEEA